MKLILKSIKHQIYEIDIDSLNESVSKLFELLSNKFSLDPTCLKILHKGKFLDKTKKLIDYNILETDDLIIMNIKAKPIINQEEAKTEPSLNHQQPQVKKTHRDYSIEIASLMDLGFTYKRSKHAIKRTKGDLTMATEMLFNNLDVEDDVDTLEGNLPKENVIQSLASICKIAGYNNPKYVENILQGLQESNPEVAQAIKNNQDEFNNLMSQPITQADINIYQTFTGKKYSENSSGGNNSITNNAGTNFIQPNSNNNLNTIINNQASELKSESIYESAIHNNTSIKQKYNLNDQEYETVLRLKDYGFSLIDCIEAYIACDKNEAQALNMLVDLYDNNK